MNQINLHPMKLRSSVFFVAKGGLSLSNKVQTLCLEVFGFLIRLEKSLKYTLQMIKPSANSSKQIRKNKMVSVSACKI